MKEQIRIHQHGQWYFLYGHSPIILAAPIPELMYCDLILYTLLNDMVHVNLPAFSSKDHPSFCE